MRRQRGIAQGWLYLIALVAVVSVLGWVFHMIDSRAYTRGKLEIQTAWDAEPDRAVPAVKPAAGRDGRGGAEKTGGG